MEPPGTHRDTSAMAQGDAHRSDGRTSPVNDTAAEDGKLRDMPDGRRRYAPSADEPLPSDSGPLPYDDAPPLPDEAPPQDDGWDAQWDANANCFYFYNRFTNVSQWENPRVPEATSINHGSYAGAAPGTATSSGAPGTSSPPKKRLHGGYNPAIHGNYDPNADYAKAAEESEEEESAVAAANGGLPDAQDNGYVMAAHFNRFNGRFQPAGMNAEYHNDANKSLRQQSNFYDVHAAADSHQGKSLKEERRKTQLTKKQLKEFKEKHKKKKEEKRRAWLLD